MSNHTISETAKYNKLKKKFCCANLLKLIKKKLNYISKKIILIRLQNVFISNLIKLIKHTSSEFINQPIMIKYFLLTAVVWWLTICTHAYGYFEHVYQCNLSGTTINISIQTNDHSYNCMQVVNFLYQKEQQYTQEVTTLDQYDHSQDPTYRSKLRQSLIQNQNNTRLLRQKFLTTVASFEQDLFTKVKKIIIYKLNVQFINLVHQQKLIEQKITTMIHQWNTHDVVKIQQTHQQYLIKLMIRNGIKNAENFATLMAYLQLYKTL